MTLNGCPIGVRASAGLARLTCNSFDQEFKTIMDTNKLETEVVFRYLDDHRNACRAVAPGWRWVKGKSKSKRGKLRFRNEWVAEDEKLTPVERTARVLNDVMNSV